MVGSRHELGERRVAEDDVVGQADACHLEVEGFGAVVLARAKRYGKAYSPQRNRGVIGGSDKRPCGGEALPRYLPS